MEFKTWHQIILILIAVWTYRLYNASIFHNWSNVPKTSKNWSCKNAIGMDTAKYGNFIGTEDIEISYKHNLAFVSVGLRYSPIFHFLPDSVFKGIFIYNLDKPNNEEPIKISIPFSNPHGLSIFHNDDNKSIRIFLVSHESIYETDPVKIGKEEVIVFDYNFIDKIVVDNKFNRLQHEMIYSSNDIDAISKNSFVISQDSFFKHTKSRRILKILEFLTTLTGGSNFAYHEFNEDYGIVFSKILANNMHSANGIKYRDKRIYVSECAKSRVTAYNWNPLSDKNSLAVLHDRITFPKGFMTDNINFDSNNNIYISGFNNAIKLLIEKTDISSVSLKLNAEFDKMEILADDKKGEISATSVGVFGKNGNRMFIGSVHRILKYCEAE